MRLSGDFQIFSDILSVAVCMVSHGFMLFHFMLFLLRKGQKASEVY